MKSLMAALVALVAVCGTASAQDVINGAYDGRSITGWSYSHELSEQAGLAVWIPADGSVSTDGLHCGIRLEPGVSSNQQWDERYGGLTADAFAATFGPSVESGSVIEHTSIAGRRAFRFSMIVNSDNRRVRSRWLALGGAEATVLLFCHAPEPTPDARLALIDNFFSGTVILTGSTP